MKTLRSLQMCLAAIWLCMIDGIFTAAAQDFSADQILAALHSNDALYTTNLTIRGSSITPPRETREFLYLRDWQFSASADETAVVSKTVDFDEYPRDTPRPVPLPQSVADMRGFTEPDGLYVEILTYIGPEGSCRRQTMASLPRAFETMADLAEATLASATAVDSKDAVSYAPIQVLWPLGRGYARYLNVISSVEKKEGQHLQVTATGINYDGLSGIWNLLIDPAAGWTIRRASFTSDEFPELGNVIETHNEGLLQFEHYSIPSHGQFYDQRWGAPIDMIFHSITSGSDADSLRYASSALTADGSISNMQINFTVEPPILMETNPSPK